MHEIDALDAFSFCSILKILHHKPFINENDTASFHRSKSRPFDPSSVLNVPRPPSATDFRSTLKVNELHKLLQEIRKEMKSKVLREILLLQHRGSWAH